MRVAPFRALTLYFVYSLSRVFFRRNEGCPFQGIDTTYASSSIFVSSTVEMRVAPFRALTHELVVAVAEGQTIVEMRVAPFRALTHTALTPGL